MKILLASHVFPPSIGGIETVSRLLAAEWQRFGHEVVVVTASRSSRRDGFSYRVERRPNPFRLLRLAQWADVFFQNNLSLRTAWTMAVCRRPWVVTTQTWLGPAAGGSAGGERVKRRALRHAHNVYISRAVAAEVGWPGEIIPNPYDAATFRPQATIPRDRDLIFVGRLVADKGVDLLLGALKQLKERGREPATTIVGIGTEETNLRRLTQEFGLEQQVTFTGALQGADLARTLARHRILVVPSRWAEPFGVVALEGIACGCAVVGSAGGGLPEAIGPCGRTFRSSSADALVEAIVGTLAADGGQIDSWRLAAPGHLARHTPGIVAEMYLEAFARAVENAHS